MEHSPEQVPFADLTVGQFVERLSSAEPVPGGGSASAVAAALGAALVSMVSSLSTGRPKYEVFAATLVHAGAVGKELAAEFMRIADRDARAYAGYSAALKLPKESETDKETRRTAICAAARVASDAPMECVMACRRLAVEAESLAGRSNVNASSDVLVAALLAEAGARGAAENVRINLPATGDELYNDSMLRRLDAALHDISTLAAQTREMVLSGQSREPEAE